MTTTIAARAPAAMKVLAVALHEQQAREAHKQADKHAEDRAEMADREDTADKVEMEGKRPRPLRSSIQTCCNPNRYRNRLAHT
jgi:hypothetical protein